MEPLESEGTVPSNFALIIVENIVRRLPIYRFAFRARHGSDEWRRNMSKRGLKAPRKRAQLLVQWNSGLGKTSWRRLSIAPLPKILSTFALGRKVNPKNMLLTKMALK
jgi:hypothetical protein